MMNKDVNIEWTSEAEYNERPELAVVDFDCKFTIRHQYYPVTENRFFGILVSRRQSKDPIHLKLTCNLTLHAIRHESAESLGNHLKDMLHKLEEEAKMYNS